MSLRDLVTQHLGSSAIIAAAAAVLDARINGTRLDPRLQTRIDDLFVSLGITDLTEGLSDPEMRQLLGEIRFITLLDTKLLFPQNLSLAWNHNETGILQAGADVSAGFAEALKHKVAPNLSGLGERLESGNATFLDVGVGAAGLAIAMTRLWPSLKVVGIDLWPPSLALARDNVQRAGLTDRIELRQQSVVDLHDEAAFDLAWLPSLFLPKEIISVACTQVHSALRPGQWLLFAMANPSTDAVAGSTVRLRTVLWGGCVVEFDEIERLLIQIGYVDVRALPVPPGSVIALIAARRKPSQ